MEWTLVVQASHHLHLSGLVESWSVLNALENRVGIFQAVLYSTTLQFFPCPLLIAEVYIPLEFFFFPVKPLVKLCSKLKVNCSND